MKKLPVIGLVIAAVAACFAMLKRKKAVPAEETYGAAETPSTPETPSDTTAT